MVTKLAPRSIVGLMMGCYLFAYSASSFISGLIAQMTATDDTQTYAAQLEHYATVYSQLGMLAFGVVALLLVCTPALNRLANERQRTH